MDYHVANHDTDEMFYHIGAHPGFMLPVGDGETLADCVLTFEKKETFTSYAYDLEHLEFNEEHKVTHPASGNVLPLNVPMFDSDAVFFESHRTPIAYHSQTLPPERVFRCIIRILHPSRSGHRLVAKLRSYAWNHGTDLRFLNRTTIFSHIREAFSLWNRSM